MSAIVWDRNRSPYVSNSKAWRHKFAAPEKKNCPRKQMKYAYLGRNFKRARPINNLGIGRVMTYLSLKLADDC